MSTSVTRLWWPGNTGGPSMADELQLMSQEQAAKYLVVAWCKDWKMAMLLHTVCGRPFSADSFVSWKPMIAVAHDFFPWMPSDMKPYRSDGLVRRFVGDHYPKLSAWLSTRSTDLERMKCATQIQRLKCSGPKPSAKDRIDAREIAAQQRENRAVQASYELSRAAQKSHGRSAWGVCK